jgi:hypothetical protein
VRRWALSAAAVLVLAVGVFLAVRTTPRPVSADDVFQQIGTTLARQPVLHLTVENVLLHGNRIDFEFMGAEEGQTIFARANAHAIDAKADNAMALDMILTRDGDAGWLLVRQMEWQNQHFMGRLIPDGGALLIDVPVSRSTTEAVRKILPMVVYPQEVQSLIESLRQAATDLQVRESPDGTVQVEGVISHTANLDMQMLCQTTDTARMIARFAPALMSGMTRKDVQKIIRDIKDALAKRMTDPEDLEAVNQRLDVLGLVAMHQLQSGDDISEPTDDDARERLNERLRALLTGARITIIYDPDRKLLRSVNVSNVGPTEGTIRLQFDDPEIDRSLLDRSRFAGKPNVRIMTRDEVIFAMLLPMLQPMGGEPEK